MCPNKLISAQRKIARCFPRDWISTSSSGMMPPDSERSVTMQYALVLFWAASRQICLHSIKSAFLLYVEAHFARAVIDGGIFYGTFTELCVIFTDVGFERKTSIGTRR
uniref:Uncharacterized protein n=1 Tax=Trichogramma kaykai TaxID=54128 RepID=A0ABD2WG71_9HYME